MPVFNEYEYQPLGTKDSLRLLTLRPAKNMTSPLKCSITQVQFRVLPTDYDAVSYSWGPHEFTHRLEIHYNSDISYLRITTNVDTLLRYLRGKRETKYLWIDAICINRGDNDEKNHQIPLMGSVYGQAQHVHVWLGADNSLTVHLFAFFHAASRIQETVQDSMAEALVLLMKRYFKNTSLAGMFRDTVFRAGAEEAFRSIIDFFDRPWFSRRWVIQEVLLASDAIAHCGKYSIAMSIINMAASRLQALDLSSYSMRMPASLQQLKYSKMTTILEALWRFHEARCADRKDRIAALASLPSETLFHLDYAVPWHAMYRQVASLALCSKDNNIRLQILLHLFEFGHLSESTGVTCPSWVPDWSNCRSRRLPYHTNARNVDNNVDHHLPLGCSLMATLSLQDDILEVCPHPGMAASQSWRVVYATDMEAYADGNSPSADQSIEVLQNLFPLISPTSALEHLEISSLLQVILDFRHLEARDQRLIDPCIELYIIKIARMFPFPVELDFFDSLRKLASLLRDFCFLALEPVNPTSSHRRAYGVCHRNVFSGQILVPLWQRETKATRLESILGGRSTTIKITTMLAVSHTRKRTQLCRESTLSGIIQLDYDTLTIPVLCVGGEQ